MQDLASLAVALGIFICHSAALPQDQPPSRVVVNPTLVERDSVRYTGNGIEEQARRENAKHCGEYYPPEGDPGDPNNPQGVQQQCMNVCGNITQETDDDGKAHSVSCISFNQPWVTQDDYRPLPLDHVPSPSDPPLIKAGNCSCDNSFIDELANDFISALPAIANIGCSLLIGAVSLVAEIGAAAIPGVGEAIDGGMIAGIQAAKLADYTYDAADAAQGAFSNWLNPCGSQGVPDDMQKVFSVLSGAPSNRLPKGFNPPKGVKPGSGKPGDKGDPNPPKESDPAHPSNRPSESAAPSNKPSKSAPASKQPSNSGPAKTTKPNGKSTNPATSHHPTPTTTPNEQKTRTAPTGTGTASLGPNAGNGSFPAQYRMAGKRHVPGRSQ